MESDTVKIGSTGAEL